MVTQTLGFRLATPTQWRLVLILSSALSAVQYLLAPSIVESPAYLNRNGLTAERKAAIRSLWGHQLGDAGTDRKLVIQPFSPCSTSNLVEDAGEEPILAPNNEDDIPCAEQPAAISIPQLLTSPELRRPLLIIVFAMVSQQISGTSLLHFIRTFLS